MADEQEQTWDVEKYKVEYECEEHWELRKNFLEAHKDRFPEDELVCLAQVFTNVELLGCRYPKETMDLIAELSEDVASQYRERQKSKLQRTFVKASDAASSKVKGSPKTPMSTGPETSSNKRNEINNVKNNEMNDEQPCKKSRIENNQPYGNLVLLQYPEQGPLNTLNTSAGVSGQKIDWKFESSDETKCRCEIFIGGKKLAEGCGKTKKISKTQAATNAIEVLRKYYYLIEIKQEWKEGLCANPTAFDKNDEKQSPENKEIPTKSDESLSNSNIGAKLMKLMGWAGGGLGKTQQGITEPIAVTQTVSRRGFGIKLTSSNKYHFTKKCQSTLNQYVREGNKNDLVFADFDKEERAVMHQTAKRLGLKSSSFNWNGQRTLRVSRKINLQELIAELLAIGGSTEKYILLAPTGNQ